MSFVYKVVEDLVDDVLDRVKRDLDDYAAIARQELEDYVDKQLRRAVKWTTAGLLGAVMISAGLIFTLVGLVRYLSELVNPALAWGLVGVGMVGFGAVLLFALLRGNQGAMKRLARHNGGN